jgi:hypothetical protein
MSNLPTALPIATPIAMPIAEQFGYPGDLPRGQDSKPLPVAAMIAPLLPPMDQGNGQVYQSIRLAAPDIALPMNRWVRVMSTFLWGFCYQPYGQSEFGDLQLEFVNGFIGHWSNTHQEYPLGLLHAPSKGKYHLAWNRYHGPYNTIREQVYYGAALKARRESNHFAFPN